MTTKLRQPESTSPTPSGPRPPALSRIASGIADTAVAAPVGVLAGLGLDAALARFPAVAALWFALGGVAAAWVAYRGTSDREGRGVGRWLAGVRLVRNGAAPGAAAFVRAAAGPIALLLPRIAGTSVERAERLPLPERIGGAIGRNKLWCAASASSVVILAAASPLISSRLHAGADAAAWARFDAAHHHYGCCASRTDLPVGEAFTECSAAIDGVLELKRHGHFPGDATDGGPELLAGCAMAGVVDLAGAPRGDDRVAADLVKALDGSGDERAQVFAFLGADPTASALVMPGGDALVRRLLLDGQPSLVIGAAATLRPLPVERVRPIVEGADAALAGAVPAAKPGMREGLAHALGLSTGDSGAAMTALRLLVQSEDFPEALTAASSLFARDPKDVTAAETLGTWLTDTSREDRHKAAFALLREAGPASPRMASVLASGLESAEPMKRIAAAEALFVIRPHAEDASRTLLPFLLDDAVEPVHREAARAVLARLAETPEPLAKSLAEAKDSVDPERKARARQGLAMRGLPL